MVHHAILAQSKLKRGHGNRYSVLEWLNVLDIFGVMAAGGRLVMPDPDLTEDPEHWLNLLEREQVADVVGDPLRLRMRIRVHMHAHANICIHV